MASITFRFHDGGRAAAGYRGSTGDCAVRALAIATGIEYGQVYDAINVIGRTERTGRRKRSTSNSRMGVYRIAVERYLAQIGGWSWHSCMSIGSGCTVHLRTDELPAGRLIVSLSRHYAAVIDGVLYDLDECSRDGTRCVYGYWRREVTPGRTISSARARSHHDR